MKMNNAGNDLNAKKTNIVNVLLIVLAILIFGFGGYILLFKDKRENPTAIQKGEIKEKIEFTKDVVGEYGELYLDIDGRVYYVLSPEFENNDNLASFLRRYDTVSNDIYGDSEITAILLNISSVRSINYVDEDADGGKYIILQTNGKRYCLKDTDLEKGLVNLKEDDLYNNFVNGLTQAYAAKIGDSNVTAVIERIEASKGKPYVKINVVNANGLGDYTLVFRPEGTYIVLNNSGVEIEVPADSEYVRQYQDYYKDAYGREYDITRELPGNLVLQGDGTRVSKEIEEKYGKKKYTTRDLTERGLQKSCSCGYYKGFADTYNGYGICRDYTGNACWTPDEGYINPYLGVKLENGKVTDKLIDYSPNAAKKEENAKKDIQEAIEDGYDRLWTYTAPGTDKGEGLSVEPVTDINKKWGTGLETFNRQKNKNINTNNRKVDGDVVLESYSCRGTYEECKKVFLINLSRFGYSKADIDLLFEGGKPNIKSSAIEQRVVIEQALKDGEIEDLTKQIETSITQKENDSFIVNRAIDKLLEKNSKMTKEEATRIVNAAAENIGGINPQTVEEGFEILDKLEKEIAKVQQNGITSTPAPSTGNGGTPKPTCPAGQHLGSDGDCYYDNTPTPTPTPKVTVTPTPSILIIGPSEQA